VSIEKSVFNIIRANFHAVDFAGDVVDIKKHILRESFRKMLYNIAPDIVHFHNIDGFSIEIIEDCGKMNIPMVMTLHDYWHICYRKTFLKENGALCETEKEECPGCKGRNCVFMEYMDKIDLLISPSKHLAEKFINRGVSGNKLRVINNGIDVKRFNNTKKAVSKKIRFGFAGTIRQHKGVENLLKALFLLKESGETNFFLTVAGKGESLFVDYFKRSIKEFGLKDFVRFSGEINNKDMNKFYNNIDVLVVPSIWPENSPVTIMEALASGTPVLASDIGGIPELIQDGVQGYLHKHDEPGSLMKNMKKIIDKQGVIEIMRKACLEKARKFNIAQQVELISDEYNRLMGYRD
jgi:glycosyltransferase involved in cell wall biosynthesis